VLNQSQPYSCVRCSKPFGTLKAIEAMLANSVATPCSRGRPLSGSKCAAIAG